MPSDLDQDIAPLYDLIKWETYANIYWVGNYNGQTVAVPLQPATAFTPLIPAQPQTTFRSTTGEGIGSPLEYIAGSSTVNETFSGSPTAWNNPKNWSLSNRSYYNPYQIFPGQPTPNGYPKKRDSANPSGLAPAFGAGSSTVPSDTLEKFEVQITRSATSNPTVNINNLTVDGTVTVNSGISKDFGPFSPPAPPQIRTAYSRDGLTGTGTTFQKRMARGDIIPQVANAQQNITMPVPIPQKVLTIDTGITFNIGGDLQVQVNGSVTALGTSNLRIRGNIEAVTNLSDDNQQPPANGFPGDNTNGFLAPTWLLPTGTSTGTVNGINQLNFNDSATLTMNGIGLQQIRAARNPLHNLVIDKVSGEVTRSEERRVGKEC